jgi:hypothetical protein
MAQNVLAHHGIPEEGFQDMLKYDYDPAGFLHAYEKRSFVLPEKTTPSTSFDGLIEVSGKDVVYHGTVQSKVDEMKRTGLIDVEKCVGKQFHVLTSYQKAQEYAEKRESVWHSKGVILRIRVGDIPPGIMPPFCRGRSADGKTFLYSGHDGGEGVVERSFPFKGYMTESA